MGSRVDTIKRLRMRLSGGGLSYIYIAVLYLILVGCTTVQGDIPTVTATMLEETVEPEITDSPAAPTNPIYTDTPELTGSPESTIQPAALPIPTSAVPLTPEGPWLLFLASTIDTMDWSRQVWAINADGTGLTEIIDENVLAFKVQPVDPLEQGVRVAYITQSDWDATDTTLKIISLPGGEVETITPLADHTGDDPPVSRFDLTTAIEEGGLAWSPDGRRLAFVGALDGKSVDVYAYDTINRYFIRLTSGPTHACRLSWSPGGDYVLHEGFDMIGMAGPDIDGMWSARADGLGSVSLVDDSQTYYDINYYRTWLSSTELLLASWAYKEESAVRTIDVVSGADQFILKELFSNAAYAPEHNIWLFVRSEWFLRETGGGVPLTLYKNGERIDIADGYEIDWVTWIPTSDLFLGTTDAGEVYTISLEGQVTKLPVGTDWKLYWPPDVYVSPDETLWAWFRYDYYNSGSELWIAEPLQQPTPIHVTAHTVPYTSWMHGMAWSPDSQRVLMLGTDGFWIAERPAFEMVHVAEGLFANEWHSWEAEWTP